MRCNEAISMAKVLTCIFDRVKNHDNTGKFFALIPEYFAGCEMKSAQDEFCGYFLSLFFQTQLFQSLELWKNSLNISIPE